MKYDETKWKSKWRERISTWKQIRSCFTHRLIPPRLSYRSRMCSRSKTRCVFVLYLRLANMYHHSVVWVTSYSHCWAWSIIIPIIDSYEFLVIYHPMQISSIHPPSSTIIHQSSTHYRHIYWFISPFVPLFARRFFAFEGTKHPRPYFHHPLCQQSMICGFFTVDPFFTFVLAPAICIGKCI